MCDTSLLRMNIEELDEEHKKTKLKLDSIDSFNISSKPRSEVINLETQKEILIDRLKKIDKVILLKIGRKND